MNLYRVTRTDVGGQHPHHTIHTSRQQAQNDYDYLRHHTFFEVSMSAVAVQATPELVHQLLSE